MRGIGRAATTKNARQKAVEAQTQQIINIAMGLNGALTVPRTTRHAWNPPGNSLQPAIQGQPRSRVLAGVFGQRQVSVPLNVATAASAGPGTRACALGRSSSVSPRLGPRARNQASPTPKPMLCQSWTQPALKRDTPVTHL